MMTMMMIIEQCIYSVDGVSLLNVWGI